MSIFRFIEAVFFFALQMMQSWLALFVGSVRSTVWNPICFSLPVGIGSHIVFKDETKYLIICMLLSDALDRIISVLCVMFALTFAKCPADP